MRRLCRSGLLLAAALWAAPCSVQRGPERANPLLAEVPAIGNGEARHPDDAERLAVSSPPEDWFLSQRLYGRGVPPGALARAAKQVAAIDRLTPAGGGAVGAATWTFAGPTNIGGRVLDIAVDPQQPDTFYVAAASGGVWKSEDAGRTFSSRWPDELSQAIGALTISPDGTLYAGTGETGPGGGSMTYGGTGLYRSADGGATWQLSGLPDPSRVARIAVDPSDPNRLFAAVSGDLFNPGGERGVYRSNDAGDSWERVLAGDTPTTGAADISIDPTNPDRIFATLWDHHRAPDLRSYSGLGSGVYRSVDGGSTWARLSNGLPPPSVRMGRIGLGLAASDPSRIYVIASQSTERSPSDGVFEGFYVSRDGGDSFVLLPAAGNLVGSQATYGWWFGRVWVDPSNEDSVWVAGVPLLHSANGGLSWVDTPSVHADQHALVWDGSVDGRMYLGDDGGVFITNDGGRNWLRSTFEPWTQLYSVDVSRSDPTRIVGGAQDNGVNRSYRGIGGGDPNRWNAYVGGDGLAARIDPSNQNKVYGCFQYGSCLRSVDGGEGAIGFGPAMSERWNWFSPVELDPTTPSTLYFGGNILNRSTDSGASWRAISPDLTGGPSPDPSYPFGTITTVAAAPSDSAVLYVGTDDGRVWTTKDLGASWTLLNDAQFPTAWVTRVAVDAADADVAYATFSGFRSGDERAYVFRTNDGGASWQDITANLPLAPVNDIIAVDASLVVASDLGVFATDDEGLTWYRAGRGLPGAAVTDLAFEPNSRKIFGATYGRGVYTLDLAP